MITVKQLVSDNSRDLSMRVVAGQQGLERQIEGKDFHSPGLALSGFTKGFPDNRLNLFGESEIQYLKQLSNSDLRSVLNTFFQLKIAGVIVSGKKRVPLIMKELADTLKIPVITSSITSSEASFLLTNYLGLHFAPKDSVHGTLVDIYGTGILFIGRAAIGKSEVALDLLERGHRLVADDVVDLTLRSSDILIGKGPEMLKHIIEIRGLGVINVKEIFGVRAIRLQKRIETVVELSDWNDREDYERLGLKEEFKEYLGVQIPLIKLPIFPGKNITVIAEVIALNLQLKVYGYHAAKDLSQKLLKNMKVRKKITNYLKWDHE